MHFNRVFLSFLCLLALLLGGCRVAAEPRQGATPANEENADLISTLTFLGDSTTAHMASRAAIDKDQVWATKNRYLNLGPRVTDEKIVLPGTGEEMTIAAAAAVSRPARLVITLGIDYGVYYYRNTPETFAFYYEKLLDAIKEASPDTTLILQSIFPVARASRIITNDMVDAANKTVLEIAQRRGLIFVDVNPLLRDEEGYLDEKYCYSEDGIHLNEAAYEVILSNLRDEKARLLEVVA